MLTPGDFKACLDPCPGAGTINVDGRCRSECDDVTSSPETGAPTDSEPGADTTDTAPADTGTPDFADTSALDTTGMETADGRSDTLRSDGGDTDPSPTWERIDGIASGVRVFRRLGDVLYAASSGGGSIGDGMATLHRSTDGGATWSAPGNTGLDAVLTDVVDAPLRSRRTRIRADGTFLRSDGTLYAVTGQPEAIDRRR